MGRHEQTIPTEPPAPRAPAVLEHLQACKRLLATLEGKIPELAFAAAVGKPGGAENLATLREEIAAAKFCIESYPKARAYAELRDEQAVVDWRAAGQTMDPAEIVCGIGREVFPPLCTARGG